MRPVVVYTPSPGMNAHCIPRHGMKKRIVFATFGSLGDLHPYLALGRELRARGHQPVIASFDAYREAVEREGLEFAVMRPAVESVGDPRLAMRKLLDPRNGPEYLVRRLFMPHIRESYEDLRRAATGASMLVTHPITFAGPLLAEREGIHWVSSVLAPMSLFSAIDPPYFQAAPWLSWARSVGVRPYRALFSIVRRIARRWEAPLHEFRAELGLPSTRRVAQFEGQYSPSLNLALFSPLLQSSQADWPPNTIACGFPLHDGPPPDASTRTALSDFLRAGEPPVVFALGSSAVMIADDFWTHAVTAARNLGRRAILVTGAAPESLSGLPESVRVFQYLPYSEVFPQAAAIVHQGGIGTLAQALHAGRPQLITPVAFDQPDNARRAIRLGVARAVPFQKVNARLLQAQLVPLLSEPRYARRAAAIGEQIRGENGAGRACDLLTAARLFARAAAR